MGQRRLVDQALGQSRAFGRDGIAASWAAQPQHRQRAKRGFQRAELPIAGRECVCAAAGGLTMLKSPFGGGPVHGAEVGFRLS